MNEAWETLKSCLRNCTHHMIVLNDEIAKDGSDQGLNRMLTELNGLQMASRVAASWIYHIKQHKLIPHVPKGNGVELQIVIPDAQPAPSPPSDSNCVPVMEDTQKEQSEGLKPDSYTRRRGLRKASLDVSGPKDQLS